MLWRERPDPADGRLKIWVTTPWRRVAVGDRLWVREAWRIDGAGSRVSADVCRGNRTVQYRADGYAPIRSDERSPIHMPRWASRLTLIVTAVKIERLQDISESDARAEGIIRRPVSAGFDCYFVNLDDSDQRAQPSAKGAFRWLWESLHGAGAWDRNPEVCAISFECERRNIDAGDRT
jgi:hypothetical protein